MNTAKLSWNHAMLLIPSAYLVGLGLPSSLFALSKQTKEHDDLDTMQYKKMRRRATVAMLEASDDDVITGTGYILPQVRDAGLKAKTACDTYLSGEDAKQRR